MAITATEKKSASNSALATAGDLPGKAVQEISNGLRYLLADVFALYLKTKNFHWHMTGIHFRDYHLLLDDQGDQIFAMTDPVAERARKIGGTTLRSIGTSQNTNGLLTTTNSISHPLRCCVRCTSIIAS
jgi:starvation-inducible DNA-binding protein